MLVLSRKRDEKIIIDGGRITIAVVEIRGNKCRLAVEAPPEVSIDREEIFVAKERERANSPKSAPAA